MTLQPRSSIALALRTIACASTLAAMGSVPGCFESQPAVNQVQPNVVEKSVFAGEWYYQQTVIDTPYSSFTFVGFQGSLERITWEIQEDFLLARRSYEHIAGGEESGITGAAEENAVVAVYRIESHFDIRRAYNPVTGEELNVIQENATDRPWYDRRFMRVDWSTNLADATDLFAIDRVLDDVRAEPVAYYVQDQNDENRPRFESDEDGVYYMDIVNRTFVEPGMSHIEGFGDIPTCYLFYRDTTDCAASEIAVRNSFLRVDPSRDYEPMVYTGDRMDRFGYFVTGRLGFDEHYGVVEGARYRFVNRHNLWMSSHRTTTDAMGNTTVMDCHEDADCAVGDAGTRGSVCDLDYGRAHRTFRDGRLSGACTIPYRDREVRPIVYYTTASMPETYRPDAEHLADGWNDAFVDTVASLRENECAAHGGTDCAAERTRDTEMFVVCPSPVPAGAPAVCGAEGTEARIGDLRHHIIGYVSEPHLMSPSGYGPSSADPLTGEIIMANAFIYGTTIDHAVSMGRDMVRLLNGDLTATEIADGVNIEEWLDRVETGEREGVEGAHGHGHTIPIDGRDAERIDSAMDFGRFASDHPLPPPSSFMEAMDRMVEEETRLWHAGAFGRGDERGHARLASIRGTDIERMMTNSEARVAAGVDPHLPVDDAVLEAASPLRGRDPRRIAALEEARDRIRSHACILDADFGDQGFIGLARAIVRAAAASGTMEWYGVSYEITDGAGNIDYELVREMMLHPMFESLTAHEVGHTVGLRHNFGGSYDALNYHPQYWRLRNDGSVAPRAWDALTAEERDGRIAEHQYSTVMDYGVNFVVSDPYGIGYYDDAAIAMGYGDLVPVFDSAAQPDEVAWWNWIQNAGWPVPFELSSFTGGRPAAHEYTDWLEVVGDADAISDRSLVPYTSLVANRRLSGPTIGISDPLQAPDGRPVVPFGFCSDERADLGPTCMRYDAGADAYETIQSIADTYWNYYIFTNFRRQRIGFRTDSVASRVHDRYLEKFARVNQIYALYRPIMENIFSDQAGYDTFWTRQDGMGAYTLAVGVGMNTLTRVITAPEVGRYANTTRGDGTVAMTRTGAPSRFDMNSVNVFDGRFMETTWNFDDGYFWQEQLERVGYFYDKIAAIQVLVDPTTHFVGRDTDVDIRSYQLNFATTFPDAVDGFFRGVLGDDWGTVGPRFRSPGTLAWPDAVELQDGTMTGAPLDPAAGFSIQLYAAVYGMAYVPQTYDEHFLQSSRIWVRGGAEEVDIPPSFPTVEFTDPETGFTYVALSYMDGTRETGVGAQLIQHAIALEANGATRELDRFVDNINLVRRLSWMYGFGVQPLDP